MDSKEKLYIIDGSSYFFRAFYAIQRLSNSKGFPTNAIFGFINMLLKVIETEKPKYLAIAFDTGKATFRKELYSDYKANRQSAPEDLSVQIPKIFEAVDCFGITRLEKEGFEADDIIGTLALTAKARGMKVEIITGDKDMMQLVDDDIRIFDTMKDKRYDIEGVKEKFGVLPTQVVDLLALMGDSSDNIPGVTGIGEKTAASLINEFGSLNGIYENLEKIKQDKRRETLKLERDNAFLSQKLATIHNEVPVALDLPSMEYRGPIASKLSVFLKEMDFHGLIKRLNLTESAGDSAAEPIEASQNKNYTTVRDVAELKKILNSLEKQPIVAVDTETTGLDPHTAKLVGVSLAGVAKQAFYIPLGHIDPLTHELLPGQMSNDEAKALLKPFFENEKIKKVGQNLKFDSQIFKTWGVELRGIAADTLLESYLLQPEEPHNLDALALKYLAHETIKYEDLTGKGKGQISFAEVSIEKATEYSAEDSDIAFRLHEKFAPEIQKNSLSPLYSEVELPLVDVLGSMEYLGICVDKEYLTKIQGTLSDEIGGIETDVYKQAGQTFNMNSPKQLSEVLFTKLQLPIVKKTKTGISTDESVLQQLATQHPICQSLLRYRELMKLKGTYVDGLLAVVNPVTGKIHTCYNQTVAATGRLSSSNPNLQNIPDASDPKYDIRAAFLPEDNCVLLSADYSQVELRVLADMSGDKELSRAFHNNEDVHDYTAKLIFKTDTVTSDQRRIAKTINFGVVYGQTPFGLSKTLKISPKDAKEFIDKYFERYDGIKSFLASVVETSRKQGYITTKLGRRRYLPQINSSNRMVREMEERAAINMPVQGTAADMIKIAMVNIYRRLNAENWKSKMVLQVHDELVFNADKSEEKTLPEMVKTEMENALKLSVPLKVDIGLGKNWRECS